MPVTLGDKIAEKASRSDLLESIKAVGSTVGLTSEEWLTIVSSLDPVFTSDLAWLTRGDQNWVFRAATTTLRALLTKFYPARTIHVAKEHFEQALDPFVNWLEARPDREVVEFCWDVRAWRPMHYSPDAVYPVLRLRHSGRLSGEISDDNIEIAVSIREEAEAMASWPEGRWQFVQWDSASRTYFKSLEDPSYLVRGASANALGVMILGCHSEGNECGAPAVVEILDFIQDQERRRAGVAGPFLQGANFLGNTFDEWLARWPGPVNFDMRAWLLETLKTSSREPDVPHLIPLEFFAHEVFCCDAAAIEMMLDMGREYAAVLTATEDKQCIDRLMPLLMKMSESSNPRIAGTIREYLRERQSHAGMSFFDEFER